MFHGKELDGRGDKVIRIKNIPHGYEEIIERYGDPDIDNNFVLDDFFLTEKTMIFYMPFPMKLSWKPHIIINRFRAHIDVGNAIVDALREIMEYRGLKYLQENDWDRWGGCFNFRLKRGSNELSTHAWGIAVDINPHIAPFGGDPDKQPYFIVKAFERRGFEWGGRWSYPDGQHFQACHGY